MLKPLIAPIAPRQAAADPYAWLQERDSQAVLDYLHAENHFLEANMAEQSSLRQQLFEEIRGRIQETDLSLPSPWCDWLYYQRTTAGDEYPRYYRCPRPAGDSLEIDLSQEQLLLDLNQLAGDGFLSLGAFSLSPDQNKLAYSLDQTGDEVYSLFIKDLNTGETQTLDFGDCDGSMVWANDNQTIFFAVLDDTHRPAQIRRHDLVSRKTETLFQDDDGRFFVHCYRSSSETKILIVSASKTTSEVWQLDSHQPWQVAQCVCPRLDEHEYHVDHGHYQGRPQWFIRSNQDGLNFALYRSDSEHPTRSSWQQLQAHNPDLMIEDITLKSQGYLVSARWGGLPVIDVHPDNHPSYRIELPDAAYSLYVQDSLEYTSPDVRLRYESLNRPAQVRRLNLADGQQSVLKQVPVLGHFDAEHYQSLRLWAKSADGTAVPISLVAKKEILHKQTPAPLYLYGYGAYGECLDPWFSHARLSLLERGFIFAIAHVRGGGELGEAWYRAGKLQHKHNTFSDFIACAEHLHFEGYSTPAQTVISGGSAGGLLIGAVLNQRPELFAAAIAEVPFVDALNTMLDPELPLTVTEYDEWGNPALEPDHQWIAAYAPYENVSAQHYPSILTIAGYHDSRVQYWEAAKWVAKLRYSKLDANLLLLKTEFDAGHGGKTGRYQGLHDVALEYAFILKVLQLIEEGA